MKKIVSFLAFCVVATLLMVSCDTLVEQSFDKTLLYGKWQSNTLFYKYLSDGTGATWDTADDVTEAEAQSFTWTLVQSELTHIHVMEIGSSVVTKIYTVTELTDSTLIYNDDYGKEFSFDKID
jgi:hypothetical protein